MKNFLLWFRIIRPQTLFASLVPVLVGLVCVDGPIRPAAAVITAVCAMSLQIFSNLVNDYYDFVRGSDKAGRAGFKRALAEGEVSSRQMLTACAIALGVAIVTGAYLIIVGGFPIIAIGLTAILFAWLYTATSHSLSYLGIADIFVFLYYGVLASAGTVWLQIGEFSWKAFEAGAVCGLISMCVLMINNLRDIDSDRAVGKKTLPVRLGKRGGELVMLVEVLLMPVFAWLAFGFSAAVFVLVPAMALYMAVLRAEGPKYNICLLCTGLVNVVYLILCLLS